MTLDWKGLKWHAVQWYIVQTVDVAWQNERSIDKDEVYGEGLL